MAKKRGLSADEKRQKMLQSMLDGVRNGIDSITTRNRYTI